MRQHERSVPRASATLETQFGRFEVGCTAAGVRRVLLPNAGGSGPALTEQPPAAASAVLEQALAELSAYFAGERECFTVPLDLQGTGFQQEVWRAVLAIPFGRTGTYRAVAQLLGRPGAARAVGGANGANPLPVLVPCHRLVGSDGSLTGYAGGLKLKRCLLEHEQRGKGELKPQRRPA